MSPAEHEALVESLQRGVNAARQLSALTDELTEELAQIERAFSELRLGVCAQVQLTEELSLAFEREGKMWRLTVRSTGGSQLLINASRGVRIQAASKLNDLLAALATEAEVKTEEVRLAKNDTSAYLASVREFITRHERT